MIACAALLCFSSALPAEPARTHDIELQDYFSIAVINALAVSPDGKHAAYIEQRWEGEDEKRNADLWVVALPDGRPQRLTFDKANEGSPRWSPDGKHIYYTANYKRSGEESPPYNGKNQVWRIAANGGEPFAVTRIKDGVSLFDFSADGETLYYIASKETKEDPWKDLREKYDKLTYGHGVVSYSQLWKLDLNTWRDEKLVDESRVIAAMHVAPDGSRIAMLTLPDEEVIHNEGWSRVDVYNTATEQVEIITEDGWRKGHSSPFGWVNEVVWSDDSLALGFSVSFDGFPTLVYAAEWLGDRPQLHELARPKGVSINGGSLQWKPKTRDLCFIGEERARARAYSINNVRRGEQSAFSTLTPGDVTIEHFSFSKAGDRLAVIMPTLQSPPDVFLLENGDTKPVTRANPQVDTWKLPQISLVQWTSEDGRQVEGILELPPGHKPGDGPLPMLVEIHGGPTSATLYQMQFWIYGRTLMPAKGYALLSPNYRGSTGYGDDFLVELVGRENDIEVKDILAGVDAMVQRGIADPDRLGVSGWSNGGFLTNAIITATDRFKAASSGAGVIDQIIQWGVEDTPGHVINFMKGTFPWSDPDKYRSSSPLYALDKAKTPTLIHVGENDERVPAAHARTLYRALKYYLDVPTELIVYPGEGHGLTKYKHRKAKMEWDLTWFNRYVLDQPTKDPEKPEAEKREEVKPASTSG
jgi:dipeptidyl aminopeptidase/acylaminoacyl peptidase